MSWKACLTDPNNFAVVVDQNPLFKGDPNKKIDWPFTVALKWLPRNGPGCSSQRVKRKEIQEEFLAPAMDEGTLEVMVATSVNCPFKQDVCCQVDLPRKPKQILIAKCDKSGDPYWNETVRVELAFGKDEKLPNIPLRLYTQSGMFGGEKTFAQVVVDWSECLRFPGEYNPIKAYVISDIPGTSKFMKLYVKTRWLPSTKATAAKASESYATGVLKLFLYKGKNLLPVDGKTSDPYVVLSYKMGDATKEETSETQKDTVNPRWEKVFRLPMKFLKDGDVPPVTLKVYDAGLLGTKTLLGFTSINWRIAYSNPCELAIDQAYKLENPNPKEYKNRNDFGEIYVKAYYVPDGQQDPNIVFKEPELDNDRIVGNLQIVVVHGVNLSNGEKGKLIDAMCTIISHDGRKMDSENLNKNNNPIWNKKVTFSVDIPRKVKIS